jgi:uncharacterized membrane protein YfcA
MELVGFFAFGLAIGTYGTLIGAGGGFVLMPALILIFPAERREALTAVSLAVVFVNALSGSLAYARMKRINYRAGAIFAAATVPGALLGTSATAWLPLRAFDVLFGATILAVGLFLLRKPAVPQENGVDDRTAPGAAGARLPGGRLAAGIGVSAAAGFVSSLFGIGGGVVHVPALVRVVKFPVHVATATSHFVLAVMALAGTVVHVVHGNFGAGTRMVFPLAAGAAIGAQAGAILSGRLSGSWIVRGLAVALALVGLRVLLQGILSR